MEREGREAGVMGCSTEVMERGILRKRPGVVNRIAYRRLSV
jgi:hypothetical protein